MLLGAHLTADPKTNFRRICQRKERRVVVLVSSGTDRRVRETKTGETIMGFFSNDESESWEQRQHNRGQEAGSKADASSAAAQFFFWSWIESDEYNQGFSNGLNNQPKDK